MEQRPCQHLRAPGKRIPMPFCNGSWKTVVRPRTGAADNGRGSDTFARGHASSARAHAGRPGLSRGKQGSYARRRRVPSVSNTVSGSFGAGRFALRRTVSGSDAGEAPGKRDGACWMPSSFAAAGCVRWHLRQFAKQPGGGSASLRLIAQANKLLRDLLGDVRSPGLDVLFKVGFWIDGPTPCGPQPCSQLMASSRSS